MFKYVSILTLFVSLAAAQPNRASNQAVIESYVDKYKDIAVDEMIRTGIPASIKLAQAVLESNAGRSYLAVHGNNHFGIKCGKYWKGRTIAREDDDYVNGKLIKSCFRAFPSVAFSFKAHSEFLLDPKKDYRYGFLFDLPTEDYKAWAKGLKKAGYATDPKYPTRLISIIERHQLYQYDEIALVAASNHTVTKNIIAETKKEVSSPESTYVEQIENDMIQPSQTASVEESTTIAKVPEQQKEDFFVDQARSFTIEENNDVPFVLSTFGDNLESISLELGVPVDDLIAFNEFQYSAAQKLENQTMIYIEEKRNKYFGNRETYRANKGESVADIAQRFGIKSAKLRKRNKWPDHYQPRGGELVYLKGKKK